MLTKHTLCYKNVLVIKMEFPRDTYLVPCFFFYVIDVRNVISDISNPVLYADDTSLIITNSDSQMFEKDINTAILQLNRWFKSNLLLLSLEKTYFLQFLTKNTNPTQLHISYLK